MRVLACVCHICFFKFLSASAVAGESMLAFVGTCEGLLLLGCSTTCCLQSCQAPSSASMPLAVDTVVEGARSQFKTWDHWDGPRTYWFVTLPPSGLLTCCGLLVSVLAHTDCIYCFVAFPQILFLCTSLARMGRVEDLGRFPERLSGPVP